MARIACGAGVKNRAAIKSGSGVFPRSAASDERAARKISLTGERLSSDRDPDFWHRRGCVSQLNRID